MWFKVYFMDKIILKLERWIFAILMTALGLALAVPDTTKTMPNEAVQSSLHNHYSKFARLSYEFHPFGVVLDNHHRAFHKLNAINAFTLNKCDMAIIYSNGPIFSFLNRIPAFNYFLHRFQFK